MLYDYRQVDTIFKEYVDAHYEKLLKTKFEDIESKIISQYNDLARETENLILMVFLLTFNEKANLWDYWAKSEIFERLIRKWKYLKEDGLPNYWEWKVYD